MENEYQVIGIGNTALEICKRLYKLFPDKKSYCKVINTESSDKERRDYIKKFLSEIGESTLKNDEYGKHFSGWGGLRKSVKPINNVFIVIGADGVEKLDVIQPVIERILKKSVCFSYDLYVFYISPFENITKYENSYTWLKQYFKKDDINLIVFHSDEFLKTEMFDEKVEFTIRIINELIEFIIIGVTNIKKLIKTMKKYNGYRNIDKFVKYIEN